MTGDLLPGEGATWQDVVDGNAAWWLGLGDNAEWRDEWPRDAAVVSDPPYGIGLSNNDRDGHRREGSFAIAGDADSTAGAAMIEWAADRLTIVSASPWRPWPGEWRNLIAWDKGGAVGGGGDISTCLKRTWELIQVRNNGPMFGGRDESVWRFPLTPADTTSHIAAKPVPLVVALLNRFVPPAAVVVDPFAGSGTTGVACIQTGRRFIGAEIDPTYHAVARARLGMAYGARQPSLFDAAEASA